jgi:rhamnogalacturonan endolyase
MVAASRLHPLRCWMIRLWLLGWCVSIGTMVASADGLGSSTHEQIDRGLIVRPIEGGHMYLAWRWLRSDPPDRAFHVYRAAPGKDPVKLNERPIAATTDFVDTTAVAGTEYVWSIRAVSGGRRPRRGGSASGHRRRGEAVRVHSHGWRPHVSEGRHRRSGRRRPLRLCDQAAQRQRRSVLAARLLAAQRGHVQLEAYRGDGTFLWRHDLGWSIEQGIWYSPYVVYDLDGDGRAEVALKTGEGDPRDADGRVQTGPEYLTILDGQTGKPIAQARGLRARGLARSWWATTTPRAISWRSPIWMARRLR